MTTTEILCRGIMDSTLVERLQHLLIVEGARIVADGDFGSKTEKAVKEYQQKVRLEPTGIVDVGTWHALEVAERERQRDVKVRAARSDPERWGSGLLVADADEPKRPDFGPIVGNAGRHAVFGKFKYRAAPVPGNLEAIKYLDDWPDKNIVTIEVPQLAAIPGIVSASRTVGAGPKGGLVQVHRLIASQMKGLWQAWEDAGLLDRLLVWSGMWAPRFIRRSQSVLSNHAFATAFDINSAWNGLGNEPAKLGERGCVKELVPLAHEFGFFWGGFFSRKDGMHFEAAKVMP